MEELVEDLKMANDNLYCANKMLEEENKRLKNNWNKLEDYILIELKHVIPQWSLKTNYSFGESTIYEYITSKIQELKGSDK